MHVCSNLWWNQRSDDIEKLQPHPPRTVPNGLSALVWKLVFTYLAPICTVGLHRMHKALILLGGPEVSARAVAAVRLLARPEYHTRKAVLAVADRILCNHVAQGIRNRAPFMSVLSTSLVYSKRCGLDMVHVRRLNELRPSLAIADTHRPAAASYKYSCPELRNRNFRTKFRVLETRLVSGLVVMAVRCRGRLSLTGRL